MLDPGVLVVLVLTVCAVALICWGADVFDSWFAERQHKREAAIEAELDRKQAELRSTILSLADALGAEAHEARKALIRESYLSNGRPPNRHR